MSIDFSRVAVDDVFAGDAVLRLTEAQAVNAIVTVQKANGDPIDPAGARRLLRALIAIGLFKPSDAT